LATVQDKSQAIRQILTGLQRENTPLSDYNIQSSVASLLEYISLQRDCLMSDSLIIKVAGRLFQQMTIDENMLITQGLYK
jgi:hypothetical protein